MDRQDALPQLSGLTDIVRVASLGGTGGTGVGGGEVAEGVPVTVASGPTPCVFLARTWTVYSVPLVKPVSVCAAVEASLSGIGCQSQFILYHLSAVSLASCSVSFLYPPIPLSGALSHDADQYQ